MTLRVDLQTVSGGPNYPGKVVLGMPARKIQVVITNSKYQQLAQ